MVLYWFVAGGNAAGKCHIPVWHISTDMPDCTDAMERCSLKKTSTLPLFAFVSSSHWAAIPSHMSECRLDGWYMLILLCEEIQNCFVSMRIVMLPNICHFHASNITCMLRWCSDFICGMAHIMEWFFYRYSFWHLSMSQEFTYKDTSITSQLLFECPPMNYSMYIFQRSILATLECHQSGQCCRARNSFETTRF